jgi:hypothetical protein
MNESVEGRNLSAVSSSSVHDTENTEQLLDRHMQGLFSPVRNHILDALMELTFMHFRQDELKQNEYLFHRRLKDLLSYPAATVRMETIHLVEKTGFDTLLQAVLPLWIDMLSGGEQEEDVLEEVLFALAGLYPKIQRLFSEEEIDRLMSALACMVSDGEQETTLRLNAYRTLYLFVSGEYPWDLDHRDTLEDSEINWELVTVWRKKGGGQITGAM